MSEHETHPRAAPLLSRTVDVARIPADGQHVEVEADATELQAIATAFGLVGVERLTGSFDVSGTPRRVKVRGRVDARVRQTCVVTLDPFDGEVHEAVDVTYSEDVPATGGLPETTDDGTSKREVPDPILDGRIDVGALAVEFLALGLDPYPRKPGVEFSYTEDAEGASPFAGLVHLRPGERKD